MIVKAAAVLFLAINLTGDGDTPVVPITADEITLAIAVSDTSQDVCDAYPTFVAGINGAVEDFELATDMADDWVLVELEAVYDPSGQGRLTVEARDVVLNWLHNCPAPFEP